MKSEAMSEGKPEKFYGGEYCLITVVVINGSDKWRSLIINSLYVCWPSEALLYCRDFIRQAVEFIVLCVVRSEQQMQAWQMQLKRSSQLLGLRTE
jgi:hypothetical protein